MDEAIIRTLAQVGTTGGAILVIAYFVGKGLLRVVDRMVAAIDRVGVKIDDHTANETAHVARLSEDIGAIKGRLGIETAQAKRVSNLRPITNSEDQ